jgi:hypothetical protein
MLRIPWRALVEIVWWKMILKMSIEPTPIVSGIRKTDGKVMEDVRFI